ncbi:DUF3089 domain-containing protein [Erythrobacter sp. SCSIO 43205]|uniref:DUF3089 domain-containing protein n=1 Tax=Erythrobacter sp. SCSIO 43205 TaxID=2779361 RepID=UPI001CA7BF31|nr:DUF3089 domain-containing protein [Erythrobacter sp. SCSIO 43205]UAB79494.1 DUF3089 domain-containing protein [Erythrobacter sp. SCSIO 43205]
MARKFLYFIAIMIVLVFAALIVLRVWSQELTAFVFVPDVEFVEQEPLQENAYQDPAMWYSRPGIGVNDPARWQPALAEVSAGEGSEKATTSRPVDPQSEELGVSGEVPDFAVFFVHPTSYRGTDNWNAPIGDQEAEDIARIYIRGMASPFNAAQEIWAPRYRQATLGAFLTTAPEAEKALDAAYADVLEAFRFFLDSVDEETPIVLVGHSQGSLHLLRLLREEVKDSEYASRVVASYAIGWPISVEHDLPALGVPACATPSQTGCILSWSSYAEPADPSAVIDTYAASTGFDGQLRGDSQILCTNPLTGKFGGEAEAQANLGTLVPDDTMANGELVPGAVPARCVDNGLLMIGDPPEMGSYVLPGNNYHVYDIPLFWANTKADVARRVSAFVGSQEGAN